MTVTDTLPQAPTTTQSGLDFDAVLHTHETVSRTLPETPAWSYPLFNAKTGVEVIVKRENVQPTGTFRVRGGVTLMAVLSPEKRHRSVVTASIGNHAQSLVWAGVRDEVPVAVIALMDAPARKIVAVRVLGARVVVEGEMMCKSLAHAKAFALHEGMRTVSPRDEPVIVFGHTTTYLELFHRHPDLEVIYTPVGSGSGAASVYLVCGALTPGCRITGIQPSTAPAARRAWTFGGPVTVHNRTRVVELVVGMSSTLTQSVLGRSPNNFILVDDDAIQNAVNLLATHAYTLAEGIGAASLAGLMVDPTRQGHCAIVYTGSNTDDHELAGISADISTRIAVDADATLNC